MLCSRSIVSVAVVAVLSCAAYADTIYVDDDNCPGPGSGTPADPYCSIQTAIDNAADTDEIVVAPGTYFETVNFLGKAITLQSSGGLDVTIIDAQQTGTVVTCNSFEGSDTVLDGFTITNGYAAAGFGSGMFNYVSCPTIVNCTFSGNEATNGGGGMYNYFLSSPTVTNCTFSGNTGLISGGGMYNEFFSGPTVANCSFSGNTASVSGYDNGGGGMYNVLSAPTLTDCTFSGNVLSGFSAHGGGIYNEESSPTLANCTFSGNIATGEGGGIYNQMSNPTVTDCTFTANSAWDGAGMANRHSDPDLINSTFAGNFALYGAAISNWDDSSPTVKGCFFVGHNTSEGAGAVWNHGGAPSFVNCTFSGNSSHQTLWGDVMWSVGSTPTLINCIVWGNGGDMPDLYDGEGAVTTVTFSDVQGGWPGTGNIDADPLFADADRRLSPGSPCIDAGINSAVPDGVDTDLDGNPRFVDDPDSPDCWQAPGECGDPPVVDMGAYEFQPEEVALDIKPGSCPNSFNRDSNGVLPVALAGTPGFDVTEVDIGSIRLSRADGVGGAVAPHEGPPGPYSVFEDVATPFAGETCECIEAEGDGIMDLSLKFLSNDVVGMLDLNGLPDGDLVELVVSGQLLDGTDFSANDCIRLVPPGTPPGAVMVSANLAEIWVDATPLDNQLDGGGFTFFSRTYPLSTVVTVGAPLHPENHPGWVLDRWYVNGVPMPAGVTTLTFPVDADMYVHLMQVVYREMAPTDLRRSDHATRLGSPDQTE
jgi:parallel beta-helix repeat protein